MNAGNRENAIIAVPAEGGGRDNQSTQTTTVLPAYPMKDNVYHLTTEEEVDDALAPIVDGVVGFDSEFHSRTPTKEELIIDNLFKKVPGNKKSMVLTWQVIEKELFSPFPVAWDNIALYIIQIARGSDVWVINLFKIRAYPKELERVLRSPDILKVGVGLGSDIHHLWTDLRTDMKNMIDVGLMARLLLANKYPDQPYGNLSLQTSVAEILGYHVDKAERDSNWKEELTGMQVLYAAIDASASLKLYEALVPALDHKKRTLRGSIPKNWYSMNSSYGEPMRKYPTIWGEELPWSVKDCYWYYGNKFQGYT